MDTNHVLAADTGEHRQVSCSWPNGEAPGGSRCMVKLGAANLNDFGRGQINDGELETKRRAKQDLVVAGSEVNEARLPTGASGVADSSIERCISRR